MARQLQLLSLRPSTRSPLMYQSVTYTDLRFARSAPEKSRREEWGRQTRYAALGVLSTGLFLLSITISRAAQYLQASRHLQHASRAHAAERQLLEETLRVRQASLAERREQLRRAEAELNSTALALRESRAAENRTRRQLQLLQTESRRVQADLSRAPSCQQIGNE